MAFWEFLLQKEGDRSWLPVESPQVEVLEGKYRVVARSSQTQTPVEIRIVHDATAEIPPVRRTQKRHGKTNHEGLIVIMPFTRLLPGVWQLRCLSDVMSDLMGAGWEYTLNLHVLPLEPDVSDEWDSDWGEGVTAAEGTGSDLAAATLASLDPEPQRLAIAEDRPENPALEDFTAEASISREKFISKTSTEPTSAPHSSDPHTPDGYTTQVQSSALTPHPEASSSVTNGGAASHLLPLAPKSTDDRSSEPSPQETAVQRPQQVVDSVFQELENAKTSHEVEESANSEPQNQSLESSLSLLDALPLRLSLGQETYVAQRGQAVTLMGQVESVDELLTYELLPVESLEVRLYDPRTSRILVEKRQPLTPRRLPFPFTCRITLPEHYQTYLVLGELVLYGSADGEMPPPVLACQPFNVTTDLHELIEAIANDYMTDDAELELPPPPEAALGPSERDHHSVAFSGLSQMDVPEISFKASTQKPLPPQLYSPQPESANRPNRPIELPNFSQAATDHQMLDAADADGIESDAVELETSNRLDSELDSDLSDLKAPLPSDTLESVDEELPQRRESEDAALTHTQNSSALHAWANSDELSSASGVEGAVSKTPDRARVAQAPLGQISPPPSVVTESFNDEPIPDWETLDRDWNGEPVTTAGISGSGPYNPPEPDSPEQAAFRGLNLQERFWGRLQALVADKELSHWLEVLQAEETGDTENSSDSSIPADSMRFFPFGKLKRRSIGRDAELAAQEVLAEDELEPVSMPHSRLDESNLPGMTAVLPIDEPIPSPELHAPAGELTAGQTLTITVKLPDLHPRMFVKLWLSERQSRSILEAPRWLSDFLPDGYGDLITRTELTVPHGCVEIQVEAITVEMTTQRESDKVALVREVVPADLSSFSLDELDT